MRYTQRVLRSGEEVLAIGKLHWLYSVTAYLWLLALGVFLIGIVIFLVLMIHNWTNKILVTTDRLIYKTGWIARHAGEIVLTQTVMGRIFGYGSLRVSELSNPPRCPVKQGNSMILHGLFSESVWRLIV
jgi:hypothetical protein